MRWLSPFALSVVVASTGCGGSDVPAGGAIPAATAPSGPDASGDPTAEAGTSDGGTSTKANAPGKFVHDIRSGESSRRFIVYVPEKARGTTPAPVVMMLHGAGGDGEKFYAMSGWREKADATGLIAVFPTALTYCWKKDEHKDGDFDDPGERNLQTIWSSGDLGSSVPLCSPTEIAGLKPADRALITHPLESDITFMGGLIDFLEANYAVDPRRVYVSGFSSGGVMASFMAQEMSERVAAVGVASGTLNAPPRPASRAISVFRTMGQVEPAYQVAFGVQSLPLVEPVITYYSSASAPGGYIHDVMHAPYLTTLGLADSYAYSELNIGGKKVIRYTYAASTKGAANSFESHVVEGLSHEYPNGQNHPVVMADLLWDFFQKHAL